MSIERNRPRNEQDGSDNLAEQVIATYKAGQLFDEALFLTKDYPNSENKTRLHSSIGRDMAKAGFDPSQSIHYLKGVVSRTIFSVNTSKREALYGLSGIYLAQGKPLEAFEIAGQDAYYGRPVQPGHDLFIARELAKIGLDPRPALERALKHAGNNVITGKMHDEDIVGLSTDTDKSTQAQDYIKIALTTYELIRENPHPLFSKAEEIINGLEGFWKASGLSDLALGYEAIDEVAEAIAIAKEIVDNDPQGIHREKKKTLESIARNRLEKGDTQVALLAARERNDTLFTAEIAARCAIVAPKQGLDPKDFMELALQKRTDAIDEKYSRHEYQERLGKLAFIDAVLARAQIASGQNGESFIARAKETLSNITDSYTLAKTNADIGVELSKAGLKTTAEGFLAASLEATLADFNTKENPDSLDTIEWIIFAEDMTDLFLEYGLFEFAQTLLLKMKEVSKKDQEVDLFKTEMLSNTALQLAKKGLSPQMIKNLSNSQIHHILAGSNQEAKKAITYFGLDKKI